MSVRHMRLATVLLTLLVALLAMTVQADNGDIRIERATVQVGNFGGNGRAPVTAHVEGTTTHFCNAIFHDPEISRNGNSVTVRLVVENVPFSGPGPHPACGTMTAPYRQSIDLGAFATGDYTLTVNDYTTTFTVPGKANGDVIYRRLLAAFAAFFGNQGPSDLLPGRIVVELKDGVDFHALDKDLQQLHGRDNNPAMPELSVRVIEVPPGTEQEAISVLRKNPNVKDAHQDHFTTAD